MLIVQVKRVGRLIQKIVVEFAWTYNFAYNFELFTNCLR